MDSDSRFGQWLDNCLFEPLYQYLTKFPDDASIEAYFDQMSKDFDDHRTSIDISFALFSAVDTKTAALLTHISVLVAAVSILYTTALLNTFERFLLLGEISVYLCATILCLGCVRFPMSRTLNTSNHKRQSHKQIIKRTTLLTFASDVTIGATMALVVLLALHWFWQMITGR